MSWRTPHSTLRPKTIKCLIQTIPFFIENSIVMTEPTNLPSGYRFTLPAPEPGGSKLTDAEAEQLLQENIVKQEEALCEALFALAKYFQQTGRHPLAMEVINRIASLV
jgi:hypothetical protein